MIEKRTVLILGAGASIPYGFPSGRYLRELILQGLGIVEVGDTVGPLTKLLREIGFERSLVDDFRNSLQAADPPSVDVFLEGRRDFLDIGKAAIAAVLLPFEDEDALFTPWIARKEVQQHADKRWYDYFANTLALNFRTWSLQRLTIITYNYDRSLDHYLWLKLFSSGCETQSECWRQFQAIPIIHLHGELGVYDPLKETESLPYGSAANVDSVKQAAAGIRIIHEVKADKRFEQANVAIDEAEVVCFLGFGYAPENMSRLKLVSGTAGRAVIGTAYQLTDVERRRLKLERYLDKPFPFSHDILRALKDSSVLG